MSGLIRNIQQSVQYRDVVKQAPDLIVFIDGQEYLVNPYLGTEGVPVAFNNFVNSYQASYDTESMIPTASLTLSVPNHLDYLFRSPGGNNLLKTMAEIRVFAKGYYFASNGNTIYRQVFKGFVTSIGYTMSGKMTNITLQCIGALGILERMQIDYNPSVMSSSPTEATVFSSTVQNLNPYEMIAQIFLYSSMIDGFEVYSVQQAAFDKNSPYYQAVQADYVAKWQAILFDLARDVHVFGVHDVKDVINDMSKHFKEANASQVPFNKETMAHSRDQIGLKSESEDSTSNDDYYQSIRSYLPDMSFGNLQLLNGRVMSRLERLRYICNLIGFEAYQDVDGGIVVKPPLYNLDVTNINNPDSPALDAALIDIYEQNNPFVVELSEVLSDSESEDESAVRVTRITAQGSLNPAFQFTGTEEFLTTAEDVDVPKLAQFGLRTQPPVHAPWFRNGDAKGLYAFAVAEMARANRSYQTYSVTIPMRPELKLGFPMYFPYKDMYGYIRNISLTYTKGADALMTVTLDSLRKRPMFPETQNVPSSTGQPTQTTLLTPQLNLVLQWTSAPTTATAQSPTDLSGNLASLPLPEQLVVEQELQMMNYRKNKIGNSYGTASDSTSNCWRVQSDSGNIFNRQRNVISNGPGDDYYEDMRTIRPYTDQKGYLLIGPIPWGRWKSLKECLYDFTISDTLKNKGGSSPTALNPAIQPVNPGSLVLSDMQAFLFSGESNPAQTADAASQLIRSMTAQSSSINNYKVFELSYDSTGTASNASGLQAALSPNNLVNNALIDTEQADANRVQTLLTSSVKTSNGIQEILNSVETSDGLTLAQFNENPNPGNGIGVTPNEAETGWGNTGGLL